MRQAQSVRVDTAVGKDQETSRRAARAAARLKNINLTKLNSAYHRYVATVPRELRLKELRHSWHPVTPDHRSTRSISQWNNEIGAWRRQVYLWNGVTEAQCTLLSEAVRKGDSKAFLGICENTLSPESPEEGYDQLLNPESNSIPVTPVLFKPHWFKGQIMHPGFRTIEESEFLQRAGRVHNTFGNQQLRKNYKEYINSYTLGDMSPGCD
ncbi:50S ribosomal [Babesia ovis]|uniref:50S ribosomal n=1 Tax=Babesia ovis TaxID=5869 RepID=A0A9W5TAV2_BABOV|nr:50S ribosomal [Babesia ovis]